MTEENNWPPKEMRIAEAEAARIRNKQMIMGEVAQEILDNVRGIIMGKVYEIEKTQQEEAKRLSAIEGKLLRQRMAIDWRETDAVEALIETWGPLLKERHKTGEDTALWKRINEEEQA